MRDVPVVFLTAGRLLLRHWPALVTLAFLGAAVRNGAVWAAVEVSDVQGQLGQLILVLAPLGYLLPIVAMFGICRRSLPGLQAVDDEVEVAPTKGRRLRLVDVAVSVLVPFLAVYEAYGLLDADIARFRNLAAADELSQSFAFGAEKTDFAGRLGIYPLQVALMIVVVASVLRWALGRVERRLRFFALAVVGALVEVYYTAQLAGQLVILKVRVPDWLEDRVAVRWVERRYDAVVDRLGVLSDAVVWAVDGVQTLLGSLDAVVVVPVAWLALGAVVLGYQTLESAPDEAPRTWWRSLFADVRERWSALVNGVRLLGTAGLAPMLVFVLAFMLITRLPVLLLDGFEWLIGPQEFFTAFAFGPIQLAVGFAVSMALTAPLLAAAVEWLVTTRTATRGPAAATTRAPS